MAFSWDDYIYSRLFVAVPELYFNGSYVELLRKTGIINDADWRLFRQVTRGMKTVDSLRGKTLIQRLMTIAPEIMSVQTIDFLRRFNLISVPEAHALRVAFRAVGAVLPDNASKDLISRRLVYIMDDILSAETINFIRALDNSRIENEKAIVRGLRSRLSHEEAEYFADLVQTSIYRAGIMRNTVWLGRFWREIMADTTSKNNKWDAITVVLEGLADDDMLRRAARLGLISSSRYGIITAMLKLGANSWRKGLAASTQDNWYARSLLISEGILSMEMINALRAAGLVSPGVAQIMYPSATLIQSITRNQLANHMKSTRVRALPGETPIQAFARVSQATDRALLRLLAEAADDSRKEALRLAGSRQYGKMNRAAQQRLVERSLHLQMKKLYENIGHLTMFGEKESARAALSAMDHLQDKVFKKRNAELRRQLLQQANSGIDSYISRQSSMQKLARSVYKNIDYANGRLSKEINKALLRDLNARDFSLVVSKLISPTVPGGVSYAAMRLARTEINNAFHETSIRYTIDQPWIDGYKWNKSKSHGHVDICDQMASEDHDGIGRGVYKKGNVPGKPHPHCLCYITTVTMSDSTFERRLRSGAFNNYFRQHPLGNNYSETDYNDFDPRMKTAETFAAGALNAGLLVAGVSLGEGAAQLLPGLASTPLPG